MCGTLLLGELATSPWVFTLVYCSGQFLRFVTVSGSNGNGTPGSVGRSLRNDLLVAADSVTNAMSTLVRELNSGTDKIG